MLQKQYEAKAAQVPLQSLGKPSSSLCLLASAIIAAMMLNSNCGLYWQEVPYQVACYLDHILCCDASS
jgi:hypothetical protein